MTYQSKYDSTIVRTDGVSFVIKGNRTHRKVIKENYKLSHFSRTSGR